MPVEYENFLSDHSIYEYYIGPGDEVAITGLFTRLAGEEKNLPILRRGSVAMLPDDKIPSVDVGDGVNDINGYLIEVRSVGGLSGSPVFVRAPIGINYKVRTRSSKFRTVKAHFQGDYHLLGLCQGHWEIPAGEKNSVMPPSDNKKENSINMGIAIVVPAKEILEVLKHPELVEMRKAADLARKESRGTSTPD